VIGYQSLLFHRSNLYPPIAYSLKNHTVIILPFTIRSVKLSLSSDLACLFLIPRTAVLVDLHLQYIRLFTDISFIQSTVCYIYLRKIKTKYDWRTQRSSDLTLCWSIQGLNLCSEFLVYVAVVRICKLFILLHIRGFLKYATILVE
jgi:hypothetical protein